MALPDILRRGFLVHNGAPGGVWTLDEQALDFLDGHIRPGMRTLETGAGMSTVLFALRGAEHTAIVPVAEEAERIRAHCARAGIPTGQLTFVIDTSERALPALVRHELDIVLVDGRHGFPAPMIDWFYTAPMLRVGGLLLLDDTQLWPVRVVRDVVATEPEWELIDELPRTTVFRKLADGSERKEWTAQRYVTEATTALAKTDRWRRQRETAAHLLRQGRLVAFATALARECQGRLAAAWNRTRVPR